LSTPARGKTPFPHASPLTRHSSCPGLFISDLHLSPDRPEITRQFLDFLRGPALAVSALYILGDLFDAWAGDDDLGDPLNREVTDGLRRLSQTGVRLFLMHGNRDFLFGEEFARACGAELLPDPTLIDLCGTATLLAHGDTLCTGDVAYQRFRAKVRHPLVRGSFRVLPLSVRKRVIKKLRGRSESAKSAKGEMIMDVTPAAVEALLRSHGYPRLIHGHTHRPAKHLHQIDGHTCERWVLGDWYERGSYLACDTKGCRAVSLS
jgi:UDP-2,3-diacylglucosamine hydrolase